jgi:hypothetical protein
VVVQEWQFGDASEIDKEVLYWHNIQRTNPLSLIPALEVELANIEVEGKGF